MQILCVDYALMLKLPKGVANLIQNLRKLTLNNNEISHGGENNHNLLEN